MNKNNKEQKIILVSILLLALSLMVGGTIAYYSDSGIVHNIIKTNEIKIDTSYKYYRDGKEIDAQNLKIVPGENITKTLIIKPKGTKESFIKVKLSDETKTLKPFIQDKNWVKRDDEYYYKKTLGHNDVILNISIFLPPEISSDYKSKILNLSTNVYAVQKDNNFNNALEALGWSSGSVK